jgi:hypothetical protein
MGGLEMYQARRFTNSGRLNAGSHAPQAVSLHSGSKRLLTGKFRLTHYTRIALSRHKLMLILTECKRIHLVL